MTPTNLGGPVTLDYLIREQKLLWVHCNTCGRERDINPASLSLPGDTTVPTLGRRHMKCSQCGSKDIDSRPELYPGGIEGQRAKFR